MHSAIWTFQVGKSKYLDSILYHFTRNIYFPDSVFSSTLDFFQFRFLDRCYHLSSNFKLLLLWRTSWLLIYVLCAIDSFKLHKLRSILRSVFLYICTLVLLLLTTTKPVLKNTSSGIQPSWNTQFSKMKNSTITNFTKNYNFKIKPGGSCMLTPPLEISLTHFTHHPMEF